MVVDLDTGNHFSKLVAADGDVLMSSAMVAGVANEFHRVSLVLVLVGLRGSGGPRLAYRQAMRRARRREIRRDPDGLPFAVRGPVGDAVFRRAVALAAEGCEDAAAVGELRAISHADRGSLGEAERLSRVGGNHLERATENRRYRLLMAASGNRAVEPARPQDVARLAAVAEFEALGPVEGWQRLVAAEPRLIALEGEVRTGAFVRPDTLAVASLRGSDRRRHRRDVARRWFALRDRVDELLGPCSAQADALLNSRAARDAAFSHLQKLGMDP